MAVRIRLKRLGRRHLPFYRIAVMDSRSPRDGRSIEDVGHYDPMISDKSQRVTLNMERIDYWISVGAKPSDKVAVLIDKVKKNRFGTASEPPPMTAPKEPPPPPEPAAVEADPTDEAEDAAAADDDATADEAAVEEEAATDEAPAEEEAAADEEAPAEEEAAADEESKEDGEES